ncbi:uncharacterized protein [Gossypium hirsutum]|uniref:Uncharacterized protein isoform X1 n=1 Tax=Gossypium hirsutum TaxID=3635 RepID=A0ABM3AG68_GOSHI|nr:uncharacterized protein LOC107925719 isoform X1 [Gossypium hirsutum]
MASSPMVHYMSSVSPHSPKCYHNNQTLALPHSNFLSPTSFLRLKRKTLFSNIQFNRPLAPRPLVYALQSNFFKGLVVSMVFADNHVISFIQTVWKVGKDGVEAGTNLVPDSVPRPIARISVSVVVLFVTLFVLKSFLSTAFFALYIFRKGLGSSINSVLEAKRISRNCKLWLVELQNTYILLQWHKVGLFFLKI